MATNPLELFANIRDARQHISRLKNEAHALEADPFSNSLLTQTPPTTTCAST